MVAGADLFRLFLIFNSKKNNVAAIVRCHERVGYTIVMSLRCSQCSRPAVVSMSGQNLCVEHAAMMANIVQRQQAQSAAMINYLTEQIEYTMGVPFSGPRIAIPQPPPTVVHRGHLTSNQIRIDRSVIGAVNTAEVAKIEVSMNNIQNQDSAEFTAAIKVLTEAFASNAELQRGKKEELLEILSYLSNQATLPEQQQQKTLIKQMLSRVPKIIASAADLTTLWTAHHQTLVNFFHLSH